MWRTTNTETVTAPASAIWALWSTVPNWLQQDPSLESASINGPFAVGSVITLKPKGSPTVKITITEFTPNVSFSALGKLPLAELHFDHALKSVGNQTSFTVTISMTGPFSGLWGALMGGKMASNLVTRMKNQAATVTATN